MNCPQCAAILYPHSKFCSNCGLPLKKEKEESENERLMIFSDAVIAFAITLAAIPLRVPKNLEELQKGVFILQLVFYILSFFLVHNLWKEHHSIFHHIKRNNSWLIAFNSVFLAMIVLIPVGFTIMAIGLNGFYKVPPDSDASATVLYGSLLFLGAQFGANMLLLLIWWSARRRTSVLFGERVPEPAFLGYITWRLFFNFLNFVVFITMFALTFFLDRLSVWVADAGVFALLLVGRWLFFHLYRRRHQETLDLTVGSDDTTRMQLFSDAIFAIAITITVAQIDPAAPASDNWSFLGTYAFSFIILGVYWLLHYRIFHFIQRFNPALILLNFWFLLLIILAFIPARLYTSHMHTQEYIAIFSVYQCVTAGILFVIWQYAQRHKAHREGELHLIKREISQQTRDRLNWILIAHPCVFLVLAVASYVTPILTIFYIMAYLALLGLGWWLAHRLTHDASRLTETVVMS